MHPFAYLGERADVLPCCKNALNLDVSMQGDEILKARCRRCGRGHIRMVARGFDFAGLFKNGTETTESGLIIPRKVA